MERLLPWLRRSGWAYLAVAFALALVAWRMAGPQGGGGQPAGAVATAPAVTAGTTPDAPAGLVHVAGAVRRPGVYEIGPGTRVVAVIRKAGGPTRRADLSALNLAATLEDGQQVLVPQRVAAGAAPGAVAGSAAEGPVRLATATADQLDGLDGIGPTLAARILEWRDAHGGFASVDQLLEVPGIGPTRLEALRAKVVP